jgi:hypothetical protein
MKPCLASHTHAVLLRAPMPIVVCPGAHRTQVVDPLAVAENVPTSHGVQLGLRPPPRRAYPGPQRHPSMERALPPPMVSILGSGQRTQPAPSGDWYSKRLQPVQRRVTGSRPIPGGQVQF